MLAGDRVIAGADEVPAARTLLDHLPDAQALVFAGAFDPVTLMRPEQVNTVLTAFLADRPLPHLPGSYTLPLKPARPCDGP